MQAAIRPSTSTLLPSPGTTVARRRGDGAAEVMAQPDTLMIAEELGHRSACARDARSARVSVLVKPTIADAVTALVAARGRAARSSSWR